VHSGNKHATTSNRFNRLIPARIRNPDACDNAIDLFANTATILIAMIRTVESSLDNYAR
jgi:hypothetical protein